MEKEKEWIESKSILLLVSPESDQDHVLPLRILIFASYVLMCS